MSWKTVDLYEACELITDGTHYTPKNIENGVPFLTVKDMDSDEGLDFVNCSFISPHDYQQAASGNSAPHYDDVLFSKDGTVGKVHVVKTNNEFAVLSSIAILRPKKNILDSSYLGFALKSPSILNDALSRKTGSAIRRIVLTDLKKVIIPLPPLLEQKRIAAILDKADELKRKREAAIAKLDQLAQSIFVEMFGDIATNSKGWEFKSLSEVVKFENGDRSSNYPSGDDLKNNGILFLSTKNIVNNRLDLSTTNFITQEKFDSLSRGKAQQNDLIITLRGTLGSCCIFDCIQQTAFINAQMMIIRPHETILSRYLHSFLTSPQTKQHFLNIGNGAAVPQLTSKQFTNLALPVPPLKLQTEFAIRISQLEKLKADSVAALAKQNNLFTALQHQAFSGQL